MIEWVLIPADELDRRIEAAVARALAAREPKVAPEPTVPAFVGLMELGPLIGRDWCRDTALAVTLREGFPRPSVRGKGGRRSQWPGPAAKEWLERRLGVLPAAYPRRRPQQD